jgi:hypothetical protein
MDAEVEVGPDTLVARAVVRDRNQKEADVVADVALKGTFAPAKDKSKTETAARSAFEKLGDTRLQLGQFVCHNPEGLFGPISMLNELRRLLATELQARLDRALEKRNQDIQQAVSAVAVVVSSPPESPVTWAIKTDRIENMAAFEKEDWEGVQELIVDVSRDSLLEVEICFSVLAKRIGKERIRLALPALTRASEVEAIHQRMEVLHEQGWTKWQASNLSAWSFLGMNFGGGDIAGSGFDLTVDWPIYVLNRESALAVLDMGARGFTLSPEDTRDNMRKLLAEFGDRVSVIVYQDTPLFISASCAYVNLAGDCRGRRDECERSPLSLKLKGGETVLAVQDNCRTVVINEVPFCLVDRLAELKEMGARRFRVDFIWQAYTPEEVRDLWRQIRSGRTPPPGYTANFTRGLV